MQQAAWAKNLKGIKEQFTVVGPAKQLSDYAPKSASPDMSIQIPMTMYGAKIESTGAGEDGIVQPEKPVDAVVTDQGPKMLHEGEFKIVGPDGKMAVIPAKMIPQEMLAAFEQQSGTKGYAAGIGVMDDVKKVADDYLNKRTAPTTMTGGKDTSGLSINLGTGPAAPLEDGNKNVPGFYTDKEKTGLNTLEGVATGKSDAFSAIANRRLDDQAARNQWASKAFQQTQTQTPELTAGARDAGAAVVAENANSNMSSIQGDLAANAQNAAVGAANSLVSGAQSGEIRTQNEKQVAYDRAIAQGDTSGAAAISATMTGTAGRPIDMTAANYEQASGLETDVTADAASRPGQDWRGSPSEQTLQRAFDLRYPDKKGMYDSPEFAAYADDIWGNAQQSEEEFYLKSLRTADFYVNAPEDSLDVDGDMRADSGPMIGKFTKKYYESAAQAVIDAKVSNGMLPGVNPDGSVYWTSRDAEGNETVVWGERAPVPVDPNATPASTITRDPDTGKIKYNPATPISAADFATLNSTEKWEYFDQTQQGVPEANRLTFDQYMDLAVQPSTFSEYSGISAPVRVKLTPEEVAAGMHVKMLPDGNVAVDMTSVDVYGEIPASQVVSTPFKSTVATFGTASGNARKGDVIQTTMQHNSNVYEPSASGMLDDTKAKDSLRFKPAFRESIEANAGKMMAIGGKRYYIPSGKNGEPPPVVNLKCRAVAHGTAFVEGWAYVNAIQAIDPTTNTLVYITIGASDIDLTGDGEGQDSKWYVAGTGSDVTASRVDVRD